MTSSVSNKYRIPVLDTELVERKALMARLDQGLARRLTLVSAHAGYGKTTAVAMWAHALTGRRRGALQAPLVAPVAWYSLDPDDDEFSTFATRLVRVLEAAAPGAFANIPTGLTVQTLNPAIFADLVTESCLRLPDSIVLVLDDYHLLTTPAIHLAVNRLIQYASDQLHLVLIARSDPSLPIARLRAHRQVIEVHAQELQMSTAEAAALLAQQLPHDPGPEVLALVYEQTEGWAAGLQLAATTLHNVPAHEFLTDLRNRDDVQVRDFLIDEVLGHVTPEVRGFLLKTALVLQFNAELAALVTGLPLAACHQVLDQLRRQHLFLIEQDSAQQWFRYHHQFRLMLVDRAKVLLADGEVATLERRATDWLVAKGYLGEALAEFVARKAWDSAAVVIEADRHRLINNEAWHDLWRRLALLPEAVIANRAGLLLARAWILQFQSRNAAIPPLLAAADQLIRSGRVASDEQPVVLLGEIGALRGSWVFGDLPPDQRLVCVQEALAALNPPSTYAWVRGFAFIALVHVMVALGEPEAAYHRIVREIAAVDLGSGVYLTRLHHALASVPFLGGPMTELERIGLRYIQVAEESAMPGSLAWARFAVGWARFQQGEIQAAFDTLRPIFERPQQIHLQTAIVALPALLAAAEGEERLADVAGLVEQLRADALHRENFAAADQFAAYAAYAALLQGDRATARGWAIGLAQTYLSQAPNSAHEPLLPEHIAIFAKIVLATDCQAELGQAIAWLEAGRAVSLRAGRSVEVARGSLLLACCCWRSGREAAALRWMQEAVELAWPRRLRADFYAHGPTMAAMLTSLVQRRIAVEAATGMLTAYTTWVAGHSGGAAMTQFAAANADVGLSWREAEILGLLAEQLSNKEIGQRLGISPLTVRNHTTSIFSKLHVATRKEAVQQAQVLHLLPPY